MLLKRVCGPIMFCAATAMVGPAQTFTTVARFGGTNGTDPYADLVQTTNGSLYGTTQFGGTSHACLLNGAVGCGTIFKITLAGALTTLHSFDSTDGAYPGPLVPATNGYLYGTTAQGGANKFGTIFKITPAGALTTLYNFCPQAGCPDGANPGGLIQAANGDLYGTTIWGGNANFCGGPALGCGTIFKITPAGALTTLHSFDGSDGEETNGLMQASDGNLYGTTYGGGTNGAGTIFKITPSGVFTSLHTFDYGAAPRGGLVEGVDGDLYGTTEDGGIVLDPGNCGGGCGTIFKITPAGVLTTLYSFVSTDGQNPIGLIQGSDGDLYGTTGAGGSSNCSSGCGTIFKITPAGALTTLYLFNSDRYFSATGLVQDTNGDFYGAEGGTFGSPRTYGEVYRFSVGLGPFVKTLPAVGRVGSGVRILGTDLTGATSVIFNGTPAAFAVVSPTQIVTRVPTGATTGKVQVITPSGTLLSNVGFVVP